MNYSNPRMSLTVTDWPYGRNHVKAVFQVEQTNRGERVSRVTDNPKGGTNKPKKTTYSLKTRIVTGDNGRTYIIELSKYGHVSVMQANLKFSEESVHPGDDGYPEIMQLFN